MVAKCKVCDHWRQVQNLVDTRNVVGLQLLAGGSDHLAKEARIGLHHLRTLGIDAPTPPPGSQTIPFLHIEPIVTPLDEAALAMSVVAAIRRRRR